MTALKRIVVLYFSSLFAIIIIYKLFGTGVFTIFKSKAIWFIPLLCILFGYIIGYLSAFFLKKNHSKKIIFNISYCIAFVTFMGLISCLRYSDWHYNKYFANIEANQSHFKDPDWPNVKEQQIAFNLLSKLLANPNSFRLIGGSVEERDSIINGYNQTIFFTIFRYEKENQEPIFKAQFAVLNDTAHLIYFDRLLTQNDITTIDSLEKVATKNFNDAMKNILADSIKDKTNEIFVEKMVR